MSGIREPQYDLPERAVLLQKEWDVRLDWGIGGAFRSAANGCVTVIVDVLSFSTAVAAAVSRGISILPAELVEQVEGLQNRYGIDRAWPRNAGGNGRFTLSPLSFLEADATPSAVVLQSPNGARCTRAASAAPATLVAGLVNASATSLAVNELVEKDSLPVCVVACGERWRHAEFDEGLRFAIEDYIGAGAILSRIAGSRSPEAELAINAFRSVEADPAAVIGMSGTGRELSELGFEHDWRFACTVDRLPVAAALADGPFGRALSPMH